MADDTPKQYVLQLFDRDGKIVLEENHDCVYLSGLDIDLLIQHQARSVSQYGFAFFLANRKRGKRGRLPLLPNYQRRNTDPAENSTISISMQAEAVADYYRSLLAATDNPYIDIHVYPPSKSGRKQSDEFTRLLKIHLGRSPVYRYIEVDPADWSSPTEALPVI